MTQQSYEPRQRIRALGHLESIPNLCTACLLSLEVQPFYTYISGVEPHHKQKRAHERFAPHIAAIKNMLKNGCSFYRISKEIEIPYQTVCDYVRTNKEMFE